MKSGLYGDISRLTVFNRALGGDDFLAERGYALPGSIPDRLKTLAFPAYSPVPFLRSGDGSVLDIGCGAGMDLQLMGSVPGVRLAGLDLSRELLERARSHVSVPLIRADAAELPVRTAIFDGVVLNGVFNLVSDRERLLSECARVTGGKGFMVVADIYLKKRGVSLPEDADEFSIGRAMPVKEMFALFHGHGFTCEKSRFEPDFTREFGIFAIRWSKR